MSRAGRLLVATVLLAGLAGCHHHEASPADCRAILDRLVEMELAESGFHDPALVPRWQGELARRFDDDLRRCRSVRVRDDLPACLRDAQNPEQVAHRCMK
ncbi:MAG TPA: hypothetical protein VN962_20195 [Polyangia bacterium]|nr:hypothetical protein [Polyangia bacterium]